MNCGMSVRIRAHPYGVDESHAGRRLALKQEKSRVRPGLLWTLSEGTDDRVNHGSA
jgi:hypothetical protein